MYIKSTNLNLKQIADSGQCFRMNEISKGRYSLIALGEYVELLQVDENRIRILGASRDRRKQWEEYFDLQHDYNALVNKLLECEDEFLRRAAAFGSGLRILRQEPLRCLSASSFLRTKIFPPLSRP